MKKFLLVLLVPLVVSAAAVAAPNPASANAHCKNLQRKAPALFAPAAGATYANLAACVAAKTAQAAQAKTNAAKTCKAAEKADPTAFAKQYGSTGNGKSNGKAMGACVSATARATTAAQQSADLNAAKKCKAERADANFATGHGGKTFAQYYGTNANLKNAFGKCVSKLAKAQQS
jgi:hypothetical protein